MKIIKTTFMLMALLLVAAGSNSCKKCPECEDCLPTDCEKCADCPCMAIDPVSLTFGNVAAGADESRQVVVKNTGSGVLTILSVTSSDPAFAGSFAVSNILPGEEGIVTVRFSPVLAKNYRGFISIKSDACCDPVKTVDLMGNGTPQAVIPLFSSSLETASTNEPDRPEGWWQDYWGIFGANVTFAYLNEGYTGSHSVKVEVSGEPLHPHSGRFPEGDAKWLFEPVELSPGDYVYSNWYRSNVNTFVTLAITNTEGETEYYDLPEAPASSEWTRYEAVFDVPANGVAATVLHMLKSNGYLITDDHEIAPYYYKGFNKGLLTITFDDGWNINTETALPVMDQYGFKSVQYYRTDAIEDFTGFQYPDPKNLIQMFKDGGHEFGSHSINHSDLTLEPGPVLTNELAGSKVFLEDYLDITIKHFATPFGLYDSRVTGEAMNHYISQRTVDRGYNSKDKLDITRLKTWCILINTTDTEFEAWVKKATEENLWHILLYHEIEGSNGKDDATLEMFTKHMKIIDDYGIEVVTMSEAFEKLAIDM
ncbi:MAG: polysaccharide deacetylase family protein [Bacteroidales bacterium]|nr:polysaccharide deacetylase family protein [Bacteroidales bacterium]